MKSKTRIWISFTLIFMFGAAVGITATGYYVRNHVHKFIQGGPPGANSRIIGRMLRDISLTEEQRERIDRIVEEFEPKISELSINFGMSMRDITDRELELIKEVLTPGQRRILEKRITRFKEHFRKTFHGRREGRWKAHGGFENHGKPPPRCGGDSTAAERP